jgi:hypothetical protein
MDEVNLASKFEISTFDFRTGTIGAGICFESRY